MAPEGGCTLSAWRSTRERLREVGQRLDPERRFARRSESRSVGLRRRRRSALALSGLAALAAATIFALLVGSGGGTSSSRFAGGANAATRAGVAARRARGTVAARRPARRGAPGTAPVPILMYHVINSPPAGAPFPGLYVSPSELAAQMAVLHEAGYHAVTMDQLLAYWREGVPLPAGKPIVLSFDNGYRSQYTQALPILRRYGWVGVENLQLSGLPPSQGGMSEGEIRSLVASGWELDTQGYSHAELIALPPAALHYQVAVARELLRRRYHVPVNWFCYPSGHYNAAVVAEVKAAGYVGSTTVVPGWASPVIDPYRLPRIRVLGGTTPQELLDLILGARGNPPPPSAYT
jgi:peptidoglycan/xylan/chitin deacetylase (PgdA/CDA1 family)